MKNTLITLLFLSLFGCASTQVPEPETVTQSRDLRDFDQDGVINARDICAETPQPAIVDNDGCPEYIKRNEENDIHILFANDSSRIPDSFMREIERTSQFLNKYPETGIELKGYASKVGRSEYNQKLSLRRAKKVRNALVEKGIAPERINIVGYGDTVQVNAMTIEESHALSRRVIAKVVGEQ